MKDRKNLLARVAAGVLVLAALVGMVLAAGQQGTQNDPLVTLSYIRDKVMPDILAQTGEQITAREAGLKEAFQALIDGYTKDVEEQLAQADLDSLAFTVVDLAAGQTLTGDAGCEFLLRAGSALCVASAEPGLVDMTGGGTLGGGGALAENHLYMAPTGGHGLRAQDSVKVMVRGSYTVG